MVLTDAQLRAIGCIAVESTYLEGIIDSVIEHLCEMTVHDFRIFTAGAQIGAKVRMLRDVIEARAQLGAAARIKELFEDIDRQLTLRNSAVHGRWGVPKLGGHARNLGGDKGFSKTTWERQGEPFAIRSKRGEAGHTVFRSEDLMQIARGLDRVKRELLDFLIRQTELLPPIAPPVPERPRRRGRSPDSNATTKAPSEAQRKERS